MNQRIAPYRNNHRGDERAVCRIDRHAQRRERKVAKNIGAERHQDDAEQKAEIENQQTFVATDDDAVHSIVEHPATRREEEAERQCEELWQQGGQLAGKSTIGPSPAAGSWMVNARKVIATPNMPSARLVSRSNTRTGLRQNNPRIHRDRFV